MNAPLRPPKFYKDSTFMASPDARTLRILSEYLGPLSCFHREKIKDTIVFFGSARAIPKDQAEEEYREVLKAKSKSEKSDHAVALQRAKQRLELAVYYDEAVELSRLLTVWALSLGKKARRFVVCSGGGPGIMEAANRGARKAGGKTVGLNISLPFEQAPNPYITPDLCFQFRYFALRKMHFVMRAKALVIFPGIATFRISSFAYRFLATSIGP